MDIHKHHLLEELSLLPCTASTLWSRPAGCISEGLPWTPGAFPRLSAHWPSTTPSFQPDTTASVLSGPVASCGLVFSNVETFQYTLHNRTVPLPNNLLRLQLGLCESTDKAAGQAQPLCPSSWDNCFLRALIFFFPPKFWVFFFFSYILHLFC